MEKRPVTDGCPTCGTTPDHLLDEETMEFLKTVLNGVTLAVGAPDFSALARAAAKAKEELDAALAASRST